MTPLFIPETKWGAAPGSRIPIHASPLPALQCWTLDVEPRLCETASGLCWILFSPQSPYPRFSDPRFPDPRFSDSRFSDSRFPDPRSKFPHPASRPPDLLGGGRRTTTRQSILDDLPPWRIRMSRRPDAQCLRLPGLRG